MKFPLTEETINKVLKQSVKAKFGKGEETVLDTTVRDTHVILGEKLKVEIKQEILSAVLTRMIRDLNIDPNFRLIPHLYNMLIYESGQFFKEHKDSEKVNNMIATMVVLLPSPHEGGELIIKHKEEICKFTGSIHTKIVKWVAFYSDCTHEVLKVKQGFRVALTYNIELQFGNQLHSLPVNQKLKTALSDYFANMESEMNPKLVYYLNHLYSEKSVDWPMLKGEDRSDGLALLVAAKELGFVPSLALVVYHRLMDHGDYGTDTWEVESDTELKMLVDENNIKYKLAKQSISVYKREACYSIKTEDLIEPIKSELEGPTGNEGQPQDYWYTRAAVVIFKSKWSFPIGLGIQLKSLHDLTLKPGNQTKLKKIFDENSNEFLHSKFLDRVCEGSDIPDMIMDIALYMNDKENALKIIRSLSADKTLKLVKVQKIMQCFDKILKPAAWMEILPIWKKEDRDCKVGSNIVKSVLQTYVSSYLKKHPNDYDVRVIEYLLSEIIDLLKGERSSYWGNESFVTDKNFQADLKYILQVLDVLKNEHLEENLSEKLKQKLLAQKVVKTKEHNNILQQILTPKQFSRVAGIFLEQVINSTLNDIESLHAETYTYSINLNKYVTEKFRSFLPNFMILRDSQLRLKILNRMKFKPQIYTGILVAGAIDNLKNVNWRQNEDFLNLCLQIINEQLASTEGKINWSLPYKNSCYCIFCAPVKVFLTSTILKKETYLLTAHKKDHVTSKFLSTPTCPITFQVVKNKQKFNVTIEKTEKVVSDHKYFISYLHAGKNKVTQLIQSLYATYPPPSKKFKTTEI